MSELASESMSEPGPRTGAGAQRRRPRSGSGVQTERFGAAEEVLHGGTANRGMVVRVGDTVRRPQRSTSPATHALLRHLADVGFEGAPRFLGVDEQQREVLSFLPGTPVVPPYPDWALTDEALVSVADLVRAYHRAASAFDPAPYRWPPSPPPPFVDGGSALVSHNDLNLDNVVFRDGHAVALIDFNLTNPGSRLWDVACAARLWAPLRPATAIDDARRGRALDRFRLFADSYGVADADRPRLVEAVRQNHGWFRELIRSHAEEGHAVFAEHWNPAARERARRDVRWFADNEQAMRAALRARPTGEGR
jgi:hypothetical protein